jgi:uncharacterized protein YigE (DUF2233 family)
MCCEVSDIAFYGYARTALARKGNPAPNPLFHRTAGFAVRTVKRQALGDSDTMKASLLGALILLVSLSCKAEQQAFTTIRIDTRSQELSIFLQDESGTPFRRFDRLVSWLKARNKQLRFAMNAGMFHPDFSPVGLLVQDGQQLSPLNIADGKGNFFIKPNGVFLITVLGPRIVASAEYPALSQGVRLATQSGPLLVRHGIIHPAIRASSKSRLIRNGVGVSGNDAVFLISEKPVTFYELASYFRDELHCPDALYLDGVVSSLHSTELGRSDFKAELGPIIGIAQ